MGRGGFHGLATDHLDDVDFINIQPVVKVRETERVKAARPREKGAAGGREKSRKGI